MSAAQIAVLGAIAGFTIYLGLPVGRLSSPAPQLTTALNAVATGILIFLLWDVLTHAWEPIDTALGHHEFGDAVGNGAVLAAAVGAGLLGLVWVDQRRSRDASQRPGPGAAGVGEFAAPPVAHAGRLAMMIAVGIGLHNFAEGLAIGNSAAAGQLSLAIMLVVGFGLHNATEGFGIVAPLTGQRPSWGFLALLGLIGGGPTFVGTLVGQRFVNETVSIAFLGLAAGSILYVVIELLAVARRADLKTVTTCGIFAGLIAGFATDAIITAAGA
ncbi:putative divalent heavy-metal cations transporter (plasmid) [Mycobacterium sp. JS623]|uniref:ZIP family metal transporter n=1 Tax=Mycobacterium sp. JS623 TaxID=212767 RepID=UPI0002A59A0D|nr:ZIP family metal transporter [Mycobacterium sp. JS623]AGB26779.1 putative divalent heavy-metal cations transporter [Mycobacterium sp. JS623]